MDGNGVARLVHNCENAVQSMSRHILMDAMLRIADRGYRTVHRVHDELVICCPTEQGPEALRVAVEEMSRTPAWAPGLPLGAEGTIGDRYGNH